MADERLQKVLAARGVASRRRAEELILAGRVSVDGRVVHELGAKVDPDAAAIRVDGHLVRAERPRYLLLNKPRGYVTTARDPQGRRTVFDLLDVRERVFPVGRLDLDSEGLLLLTNDGELANRVAHPRYRLDKEYHALVEGTPAPAALAALRRGGLPVEGGVSGPAEVALLDREEGGTWVRLVIHEGRKRQVRRMLEAVGYRVRRLRRVRLGPLTLAGLPPAAYRDLTPAEVAGLRRLLGLAAGEAADGGSAPARPVGRAARAGDRRGGRETTGAWGEHGAGRSSGGRGERRGPSQRARRPAARHRD
ncbi:MAG TPA: pseudouridine synthase [Thermomicrobiales bacterium]|nr:pseudouridine synthase [Thermomicrobiales bacterium]